MVKKIMYILSLVMLCSVLFVPAIESKAQSYEVRMRCNEPAVDDYRGYILLYHSTGEVNLFYWTVFCDSTSESSSKNDVSLNIRINQNSIDFLAGAQGHGYFGLYAFYQGSAQYHDRESVEVNAQFNNSYSKSITFASDIVAYTHRGGYQVVNNTNTWANDVVVSSWGGETLILKELDALLTALNQLVWYSDTEYNTLPQVVRELEKILYEVKDLDSMLGQVSQLIDKHGGELKKELGALYVVVEDISEKLDTLIDEQKKSNTWLEKIFNWLNESKEEERQEVTTQGGNSVSQGSDAIQNSGQGFGDSLGGLVSSMSYSGTECSWTFPEVRLPAINGVMDEIVLIEEQPIDFGVWVDAIPSNILLLIRSVLTGALIIYCFKELYGTISYVLTLKGSGINE